MSLRPPWMNQEKLLLTVNVKMEIEWIPRKYQQQKLKGRTFIIKGNLLQYANFMMRWNDFTSLQRIDFIYIMQRILAKRLYTTQKSSSQCRFLLLFLITFATAKVASITAMIYFHIILHAALHIYEFHIFITSSSSFHWYITNQFNDLLPVGLLTQFVVRALHWYRRGKGSESRTILNCFFELFFFGTAKVASITAMIYLYMIYSEL